MRSASPRRPSFFPYRLSTGVVTNRTAQISGFLANSGSNGNILPIAFTNVIVPALGKGISNVTDVVREHCLNEGIEL
jgi:hypothetical protein